MWFGRVALYPSGDMPLIAVGCLLVVIAGLRLRGVISGGLFQMQRGEMVRIAMHEAPRLYGLQVCLSCLTVAGGIFLITKGSGIMPL